MTAIDLSDDSRLPALLDEREALKIAIKAAKDQLAVIDDEIKAKLRGAGIGTLSGWRITYIERYNRGYTVDPYSYHQLVVNRVADIAALAGRPAAKVRPSQSTPGHQRVPRRR